MLLTLLSGIFSLFLFLGNGHFLNEIFFSKGRLNLHDKIILGLIFLTGYFMYYGIFFRTDGLVLILPIILAMTGIYLMVKKKILLKHGMKTHETKPIGHSYSMGYLLPLLIIFSFINSTYPNISDSLLYHTQSIKWIEEFPVVPGLGNLHERFAFNNSFFNLNAALGSFLRGFWGGVGSLSSSMGTTTFNQTPYFLNGLWGIIFLSYIFKSLQIKDIKLKLFFILVALVNLLMILKTIDSPTPDLMANLLSVYLLLRYLENSDETNYSFPFIFFLFLTTSLLLTLKLSTILIFILPIYLLLKNHKNIKLKNILPLGVAMAFIIVPWLIKNYYTSGYLIFPFPAIDIFNPDWKLPSAEVEEIKQVILAWARVPNYTTSLEQTLNLRFYEWIPLWFDKLSKVSNLLKIYVVLALISFLLTSLFFIRNIIFIRNIKNKKYLVVYLVCLLNLVFWYNSAPDIRFAFGIIATLFAFPILLFDEKKLLISLSRIKNFEKNLKLYFFILIMVMSLAFTFVNRKNYAPFWQEKMFLKPLTPGFKAKLDNAEFKKTVIKGITFLQAKNSFCYDEKLPCSNNFYELNLKLRGDSLLEGFKPKK